MLYGRVRIRACAASHGFFSYQSSSGGPPSSGAALPASDASPGPQPRQVHSPRNQHVPRGDGETVRTSDDWNNHPDLQKEAGFVEEADTPLQCMGILVRSLSTGFAHCMQYDDV